MAIFATYDKSVTPWKRRTGIYGHLPKFYRRAAIYDNEEFIKFTTFRIPRMSYCGYLSLITKHHVYTFWYQGNPGYRGRKWQIFEKDGCPYPFPSKRLRGSRSSR